MDGHLEVHKHDMTFRSVGKCFFFFLNWSDGLQTALVTFSKEFMTENRLENMDPRARVLNQGLLVNSNEGTLSLFSLTSIHVFIFDLINKQYY